MFDSDLKPFDTQTFIDIGKKGVGQIMQRRLDNDRSGIKRKTKT